MRTDLIRQKAAMRAAGFEPWDPAVLQPRCSVPAVATTVAAGGAAGRTDLGRVAVQRFAPMSATSQGAAAALHAVAPASSAAAQRFGRSGSFSGTFRAGPRT